MLKEAAVREGLEQRGTGCCVGNCGELKLAAEEKENSAVITVCCASSRVDCEKETEEFLKQRMAGLDVVAVQFINRKLTVAVSPKERLDAEMLHKIKNVISEAEERFDLLSACFECGRVTQTEWTETENGIEALCGVCLDSLKLRKKHEKIIGQRESRAMKEYTVGGVQKKEVLSIVISGAFSGVITCIIGFFLAILRGTIGLIVIPGLVSGFVTSKLLNKLDLSNSFQKYAIGFVSTFVTILLLSFMNFGLLNLISGMITPGAKFHYNTPMLGEIWQYQLVGGIGGYFLAQVLYMLVIRE